MLSEHCNSRALLTPYSGLGPFISLAVKEKNVGRVKRMEALLLFLRRATMWPDHDGNLPVITQPTAKLCVNTNSLCQGNIDVHSHGQDILEFISLQIPKRDLII